MKYAELPAGLRAQVDAQMGREPRRRSRKVATEGTTSRWRCASCGEEFTSEAAFKDHPHPRIEVVLVQA